MDAVYIASPHDTHYAYTKTALEKGKHVLCEKPFVLQKSQAEELFEIAEENHCVLMEAIKTAYCPGFNQVITVAKSGVIGQIRDVEASFSRLTPPEMRERSDVRYGGSFTEFGSYTLLPVVKLMGKKSAMSDLTASRMKTELTCIRRQRFPSIMDWHYPRQG